MLATLIGTFIGDTCAYFAGRAWGRRPLAPLISPNKTLEGLLGGIAGGTFAFWVFMFGYHDWIPGGQALLIGFCVALAAPMGDLFESLLKRDLDVKDTGKRVRRARRRARPPRRRLLHGGDGVLRVTCSSVTRLTRPMAGGLVFFTGFPGFIGRRLVSRLLADDPEVRVAALVEERMADDARKCAEQYDASDRIEVITGDIGERDLGLPEETYDRLVGEMTSAYHLAAIYNLAVPLDVAQRVNVDGTGNVLDLCARADKLQRLNYVSTAYVAGLRTGTVYEHELMMGQEHKNHYESTKFQAEVWVRERMDKVPTTIYRPAIVVGDSQTGETQKFDGPYYILRTFQRTGRAPLPRFGRSGAPFNVVPVDFIVDALAAGAADSAAEGETLHLVDPDPVTAAELFNKLAQEYSDREPKVRLPPKMVENSLRMKPVSKAFHGAPPESIQYLNHPVTFDTRRAEAVLARSGVRCPPFDEYVGNMVDFFREHEDDPEFAPA